MSQPNAYTPTTKFATDEANQVAGRSTVRTAQLDAEFTNISTSIGQIETNLAIIQRDDGNLKDAIVTVASLSTAVAGMLAGRTVRGVWVTATAYALGDLVSQSGISYLCYVAHTSGTFAVDLAANKWGTLGAVVSTIAIVDSSFTITGSADATKVARFEVDGLTTATTRVYTLPDATGTIAILEKVQTFTAAQTFSAATTFSAAVTFGSDATLSGPNFNVTQAAGARAGPAQTWITTASANGAGVDVPMVNRTYNPGGAIAFNSAVVDQMVLGASQTSLITTAYISSAQVQIANTGSITTAICYAAIAPTFASTGVITSLYAFRSGNLGNAKVANAVAFKADDITAATTFMAGAQLSLSSGAGKWNLYADGTAQNYLSGITYIGAGATASLTSARVQIFEASDANLDLFRYAADATGTAIRGIKSRNATINNYTIVQNADALFTLTGYGADGAAFQTAGRISFEVDAAPAAGYVPGRIVFSTSLTGSGALVEAARITNAGSLNLSKRFQEKQGAAIASANNLALGTDGNYFQITGAVQINLIDNSNWQGGSRIMLKFSAGPTVKHNVAVSGVNKPIMLSGAADFVATADDTLELIYDSTDSKWFELGRTII